METYFDLTNAQQEKVRAFLSSADQKHKDEVGGQVELKADLDKVENKFKEENNIEGDMTDAQMGELKRTPQWLECDIRYKESAVRVRRYDRHLDIGRRMHVYIL